MDSVRRLTARPPLSPLTSPCLRLRSHYFHHFIDSEWLRAHPSHSFRLEGLLILSLHLEGTVCVYPPPLDLPCGRGLPADYDLLAPDGDAGGGSEGGEGEAPGGAGPADAETPA